MAMLEIPKITGSESASWTRARWIKPLLYFCSYTLFRSSSLQELFQERYSILQFGNYRILFNEQLIRIWTRFYRPHRSQPRSHWLEEAPLRYSWLELSCFDEVPVSIKFLVDLPVVSWEVPRQNRFLSSTRKNETNSLVVTWGGHG